MKTLNTMLKAFWQEETGLTMVEYAVAGSLITIGAVGAFTTLGVNVGGAITTIAGYITP